MIRWSGWSEEIEEKTSMRIYRNWKVEFVKCEDAYDNSLGSILLFGSRSNTMKL
jgi:hypothetical protein